MRTVRLTTLLITMAAAAGCDAPKDSASGDKAPAGAQADGGTPGAAAAKTASPQDLAGLTKWVPNDVNALMLLNAEQPVIVPFDKIAMHLPLATEPMGLIAGIRPASAALSMAPGNFESGPAMLVWTPSGEIQTYAVHGVPKGTGSEVGKATGKLGKFPYFKPEISWGTVVLDDNTVGIVVEEGANAFVAAIEGGKAGKPVALHVPWGAFTPNLVAELRWKQTAADDGLGELDEKTGDAELDAALRQADALMGGGDLDAVALRIETTADRGITLDLAMTAKAGKGAAVAKDLEQAGKAASGPVGDVFKAAKVAAEGDKVSVTYTFTKDQTNTLIGL